MKWLRAILFSGFLALAFNTRIISASQCSSSLQNTPYGPINNVLSSRQGSSDNANINASMISNQQTSYESINSINNSRQRPMRAVDLRSQID